MATQEDQDVTVLVGEPGRLREQRFRGTKVCVWKTTSMAERPLGTLTEGGRPEQRNEVFVVYRTTRGQWALHRRWAWHRDVTDVRNVDVDWNDYTTAELLVYEHLADLTAALPAEFARRVRRTVEPSKPEVLDI